MITESNTRSPNSECCFSPWPVGPRALKACSLFFVQELEGDEEGEDEDDTDVNPKVSGLGLPGPVAGVGLLDCVPHSEACC